MNINLDIFLYILALILFGLTTFGYLNKINGVAAGLFCLTLTLLV